MKKFVPIALLLCVLFSMSSFAPVQPDHKPVIKNGTYYPVYPIMGTTSGLMGATLYYTIVSFTAGAPTYIRFFSDAARTVQIGTDYSFTTGGSPYYAASPEMRSLTGIIYAELFVTAESTSYTLTFQGV